MKREGKEGVGRRGGGGRGYKGREGGLIFPTLTIHNREITGNNTVAIHLYNEVNGNDWDALC